MIVKEHSYHLILFILLIFLLPYTYGGCVAVFSSGGGGSGGVIIGGGTPDKDKEIVDGDGSGGTLIIATQASITPANAESLTGVAVTGDLTNFEPEISALSQSSAHTQFETFHPLSFILVMGDALRNIELNPSLFLLSQTNMINKSGTVEGPCGGLFSYSLNLNKVSEEFSGSLSFEDYCDGVTRLYGETDVIGAFEVSTGDFLTATFSFDNLIQGTFTLDGEMSIDLSDSPVIAVFTAHAKDNDTERVYWLKDYSMNKTEWDGEVEIEISGTFHHPDHGFVNLATTEPFIVRDEDDWPASGQIVIQGDNHTRAQLTAIDPLHCRVEADTEGDGIFEWESGVLNWTDL
jgi:hypothetical protein